MSARNVGMKVGRGLGFVAATAWGGVVIVAGAAGAAGEGFVDGASSGWDDRSAVMDAKIAASKAKREALKLKFAAEREATTVMAATA